MTIQISKSAEQELTRQFRRKLEARGFSYEELLDYAARMSALNEIGKAALLEHAKIEIENRSNDEIEAALDQMQELSLRHSGEAFDEGRDEGWKARKTHVAKKGAEGLHNLPNGFRERGDKVRELWASGQYLTHRHCAEDASTKFHLSFYTAKRHLQNAPDPAPWPARDCVLGVSK